MDETLSKMNWVQELTRRGWNGYEYLKGLLFHNEHKISIHHPLNFVSELECEHHSQEIMNELEHHGFHIRASTP